MLQLNLEKIEYAKGLSIIVSLCILFIPGYSFIFFVKRELFLSLDLIRLSFLALTITFPVFGFHIAAELLKHDFVKENSISIAKIIIPAAFFTLLTVYFGILRFYLYKDTVEDLFYGFINMILINLLFGAGVIIRNAFKLRKLNKF